MLLTFSLHLSVVINRCRNLIQSGLQDLENFWLTLINTVENAYKFKKKFNETTPAEVYYYCVFQTKNCLNLKTTQCLFVVSVRSLRTYVPHMLGENNPSNNRLIRHQIDLNFLNFNLAKMNYTQIVLRSRFMTFST